MKVTKTFSKARESNDEKLMIFFPLLQSLGVNYYEKSVFLYSKVTKAKKAAPLARKAKSHSSTSINSKSLS